MTEADLAGMHGTNIMITSVLECNRAPQAMVRHRHRQRATAGALGAF